MKKSSIAITLALLSPTLILTGCRQGNESGDDNQASGRSGSGYYGGRGGSTTSSPRGGFGGFGRFFSSGG